ncbi:MAG: YggS family pyridoxal phosphate-dependent enzyme [Candidatus Omnitrophota bacterium]
MRSGLIKQNVEQLLKEIPTRVMLVAVAKTRTRDEIQQAVDAGIKIIGENYVQEAARVVNTLSGKVKWHFIGHLQKNKIKKAIEIFDLIETVDSIELADEINRRCGAAGKVMPVFIEVNSARESQKYGVLPEKVMELVKQIALLTNIKVQGLMTMGPASGNPDDARPYFVETSSVFEKVKSAGLAEVEMRYLSMGMTNSYRAAIAEGANIIRIGTKIFGERNQ